MHSILGKKEAVVPAQQSGQSKKLEAVAVVRKSWPHCEGHEKGAIASLRWHPTAVWANHACFIHAGGKSEEPGLWSVRVVVALAVHCKVSVSSGSDSCVKSSDPHKGI